MSGGDPSGGPERLEIEVVKLGGSLLLPAEPSVEPLASLRTRLRRWTNGRPGLRVWIVGTGAWGDHLRHVQSSLGLSEEDCHWAAIGLMSVAGELAARILERCEIVQTIVDLRRCVQRRTKSADVVFDPSHFLRTFEPTMPGPSLPCDWSVTSDSIAARLASAIDADALTLLKACPAPESFDPQAWSEQGLVDGFFPQVELGRRELRWVDFSSDSPTERRYPPG